MPRKRKSASVESEHEVRKKFFTDEGLEENLVEDNLLPQSLGSRRMRHNSNSSHAHPDIPLSRTESSSNYRPSSSPIERHVKKRSGISQDLLRVNFPRDNDGFIAQIRDAIPGKDFSPYAAHRRSGASPVPYNSKDYGPRAASTPSESIGGEQQPRKESFGPNDNPPDSGSEDGNRYEGSGEAGNGLPKTDDEEEDGHEDYAKRTFDLSGEGGKQAKTTLPSLPRRPFLKTSRILWDRENSGPRRMLGRRPSPLAPGTSDSACSSSEKNSDGESKGHTKSQSKISRKKGTSVEPTPTVRGGLLQIMDDTIVEPQANGLRDLGRIVLPLMHNFTILGTFISSRGNEYFCEIDEDYLTDRFNLTGLNTDVQYYQYALDLVTDVFDLDCDDDMREQIEKSARHLYGLVHARYITTTRGLAKMLEKYKKCDFGKCPRVMCHNHPLLPTGMADLPHVQSVKLYCGKCEDLYNPKSSRHSNIDGAYFGTSFQNIIFQVYPALIPEKNIKRYEPRIFGFKVHAPATLERWQTKKREDMQERLREVGFDRVFKEDAADSGGEEMEEDDGEDGDGFVE